MRTVKNFTKKVATGFLAATVIMAGIVITPAKDVKAATTGTDVPTTGVTYDEIEVTSAIPTKDGYLFGGWYKEAAEDKFYEESPTGGTAFAKFVPAYVLSVKAQNHSNTVRSENNSATTTTRMVTAVDSDDYREVGFKIIKQNETSVRTEKITKVYKYLSVVNDQKEYTAENLFGKGALYCAALELNKIPESAWSQYTYILPYWITPDGTEVTGLPKYVRVDDGLDKCITMAVNLKNMDPIAAGVVSVSFDKSKLAYKEFFAGKVFQEMEVAAKDGYVKCVGNVATIANNATEDDMYIAIRFDVTDTSYEVGKGNFLNFAMSEIDFANNSEGLVDIDVWDVQY